MRTCGDTLNKMSEKKIMTLLMVVGGVIGSYIPTLWGASGLSFSSLFTGALGACLGIWLAFRMTH